MPRLAAVAVFIGFWSLAAAASGTSILDQARQLRQQGRLDAASELLGGAENQFRAAGDETNLATALGIHADISVSLGRYDDAVRQAGESVKLRTAAHNTSRLADDYNTIGLAYQYLARYADALAQYRNALEADRANRDPEGEVTRLNNIGNVYYFQGRYSDAMRSYNDAMQALSSVAGAAASGAKWTASKRELTLANLAVLYQRLGREQPALQLYRQLSDSARQMSPSERARVLLNQGVLYRRLGDPWKALSLYRTAQTLFATDRYADGEIGALRNVGIVLATDIGDPNGAVAAFTQALQISERSSNRRGIVQARLYRGELLRKRGSLQQAKADLNAALEGALSTGLVEEQWKTLHELGHAAEDEGDFGEAERDYRRAVDIIESVRAGLRLVPLRTDFLADKRDVYDSLIAVRLRDPAATPAEIFNWMERSRARTLLDRLRGKAVLPPAELASLQARMPSDTVLVEYWLGSTSAAALWVTRETAGLIRYAGLPGALSRLPLADARGSDQSRDREGAVSSGDQLLENVPLRKRLIVVPDGPIGEIPFEALHVPGSTQFLIERCEVSYLPSARFLRTAPRPAWRPPWSVEMIVLADPPPASDALEEHWAPLPGSAEEARAIAKIMPGRSIVHLGADMRKRDLAGNAPILHLATHAMIDLENPDRSRIVLAHDDLLQEEVYDLDLRGVDLVTLSACDTARGKIVRGENVQAFSQAFLAAGVSSVVTTLWRVADTPTREFMKQFYYALAQGQAKGAALRAAKLQFLRSHSALSDPRYWAAFVLTGDGSAPVPRAVSWSTCALVLAVVFAIAAVFMAPRRRPGKA